MPHQGDQHSHSLLPDTIGNFMPLAMEMSRVGLSKRETCTRNQWNDLRMVSNCFVTMHLVLSAGKQCSSLLNFPVAERTPDLVIERFADLNLCSLLRWLCLMQHFLHFMVFTLIQALAGWCEPVLCVSQSLSEFSIHNFWSGTNEVSWIRG